MIKNSLLILCIISVVVLGFFVFQQPHSKQGYVINQEVFNSFTGKIELEAKLKSVKEKHQIWLDSVSQLKEFAGNKQLNEMYAVQSERFRLQEEQMSRKFTSDIWALLNNHLRDFGKENNYDFILGATGDGNLMFATESKNVTKEVILFINERYKAGN